MYLSTLLSPIIPHALAQPKPCFWVSPCGPLLFDCTPALPCFHCCPPAPARRPASAAGRAPETPAQALTSGARPHMPPIKHPSSTLPRPRPPGPWQAPPSPGRLHCPPHLGRLRPTLPITAQGRASNQPQSPSRAASCDWGRKRAMAATASAGGARQWLGVAPRNRLGGRKRVVTRQSSHRPSRGGPPAPQQAPQRGANPPGRACEAIGPSRGARGGTDVPGARARRGRGRPAPRAAAPAPTPPGRGERRCPRAGGRAGGRRRARRGDAFGARAQGPRTRPVRRAVWHVQAADLGCGGERARPGVRMGRAAGRRR
jgi:hypothetical protein